MKSHRPTRRQAIVFFFFTIALVAMIMVWVFFINKGTLSVDGPAPFIIKAGGESVECAKSPCSLRLYPRKYTVGMQKDGYYNDTQAAIVSRGEATTVSAKFQFIPVLGEIGEIVLPNEYVPLLGRFIGVKQLNNFPRGARDANFSDSGDLALITLGKEVYIYNVKAGSLNKTGLNSSQSFDWAGTNVAVLEDVAGDSENSQTLSLISDITGKETGELIVTFKRALVDMRIIGSPSGKKVLAADNVDGKYSYYLIDIEGKSRKRLDVPVQGTSLGWKGKYIIFGGKSLDGVDEKVIAMHEDTLKIIDLPAVSGENVTSLGDNKLVFVTEAKYGAEGDILGVSISEAIDKVTRKTQENESPAQSIVYITEFDTGTLLGRSLVEVPLRGASAGAGSGASANAGAGAEEIRNLTADTASSKIYFEKGGRLFEIILDK